MNKNKCQNAIKYLPQFFDNKLELDTSGKKMFEIVKKIVNYDEAYIFYINPDSIQLKYADANLNIIQINNVFPIDKKLKSELFKQNSDILRESNTLTNLIRIKNHKSFVISKLMIRDTVYGFIMLCKKEKSYYQAEDAEILETCSALISYVIKDIELSNVFKIQLKALKDGILETNAAYKTIKEQNLKILESDRIKNEFLANISHELRTPLNAIIGFSEVLLEEIFGELNLKQKDYVSDIHVSGIHLLGMINEILDISKIEAKAMTLNRSKFKLSKAIDEVLNVVKPLAEKKSLTIERNISTDGIVFADFQKISQILYNLISNAIKFTNKKGKIQVETIVEKNRFILKISDNGIGIEEKYHGKIFAKFVQIESAYTKKESSTGLGLTITKELVEMHGGEISLKSELNKGSAFTVKIPIPEGKNV